MSHQIHIAESDAEILAAFDVMHELRPHLVRDEFVARVRRQQQDGYRLAIVVEGERVVSVAGYRIHEALAFGKHTYVDDLVTASDVRSKGYGQDLFDWLVKLAKEQGCEQFHLDSGVHRFDAHRFYLRNRMFISCHHFSLDLRSI